MATQSKGTCCLCGGSFSKAGMTRHLETCRRQHATTATAPARGGRRPRVVRLVVAGRYNPRYWMHLEVPATAHLDELDGFLREKWLECCGHLSAFTIVGVSYSDMDDEWTPTKSMNVPIGRVLKPGMSFAHEYDFGTTTDLTLRVTSIDEGETPENAVRLLAQNDPPVIPCAECGQPAVHVCTQCLWDEGGWLCDACSKEHECGEEMFLPVVNSPRVGMCAYTG